MIVLVQSHFETAFFMEFGTVMSIGQKIEYSSDTKSHKDSLHVKSEVSQKSMLKYRFLQGFPQTTSPLTAILLF